MMPVVQTPILLDQPWFKGFLEARGFQRTSPDSFSNGRATLHLDRTTLHATSHDGSKTWRSDLAAAQPDTIRLLLGTILASPSFVSHAEIDRRATRQRAAEESLQNIATSIREHPDTHSGQHLRRFVWSIWNGHHALNLWRMKDVLDRQHNAWVSEVFTAWMQGFVSDTAIRTALFDSGEMDRWDTVRLRAPDQKRLVEAFDAVTDLLNSTPPSTSNRELTRANGLLRQVIDVLREARKAPGDR